MSPRRSAAEAAATRTRLLNAAADLASTDGLHAMSLGQLADACALSKSAITRHFATKTELQLRTLEHALARFGDLVWRPIAEHPSGLSRLRALCVAWTEYLAGDTFPGGCVLSAVSAEYDARPGPVRDAAAQALGRWLAMLQREVQAAIDAGQLSRDVDARAVAYQLNAFALAANQARQLLGDHQAPSRSRRLMLALLA